MTKLLVTGGAGFIGSNFIRYMLNKYPHYQIINLDLLTYAGNLENLRDTEDNPNYQFIKGSITDNALVNNIVSQNVNYIINFAAESHVDKSIESPSDFVKTNVVGTQTLLDVAKASGIKKFIQISTDEVYGSLGENGLFTEETPLAPNSPYSASKASADLLVRAYHKTYGLPINITRCSNNYGPYQYPEKLIPLAITNAMENKRIPVYGDGLQIRDWLHVYDHCTAIDLVLQKGNNGEVYNVGGNSEKTNIEIVRSIIQYLGQSDELIEYVDDRLGHDKRYAIDSKKIRKLGWSPLSAFEKGLRQTIEWYIENQNWWRKSIEKTEFREK